MWVMDKVKRDLMTEIFKLWKEGKEDEAMTKIIELKKRIVKR